MGGDVTDLSEWLGFAEAVGQLDHYEPSVGLKVVVPSGVGDEFNYIKYPLNLIIISFWIYMIIVWNKHDKKTGKICGIWC